MQRKCDEYLEGFRERDEKKQELVAQGVLSQSDYIAWRNAQIATGQRWQDMVNVMAQDLTKVDLKARQIVFGYIPDAYATNFNYSTFEIEKGTNLNTSFTLYSRDSVERLFRTNPMLLPKLNPDSPTVQKLKENKALIWNKRHLQSAITQGILQGESIPKISKRLRQVTDMGRKASVRNARTMMTGAQNGGRLDAYKRAAELGIEIKKQWVATLDKRTRDSHQDMDGEIVDWDKPFSNKLNFPADPTGAPEEVYNCRCAMKPVYPEYPHVALQRYDQLNGKNIKYVTYNEWAGKKKKQSAPVVEKKTYTFAELLGNAYNSNYTDADREKILAMYNDSPEEIKEFYAKYSSLLKPNLEDNEGVIPRKKIDFGYYSPGEQRVHFMHKRDLAGRADQLPFELGTHEYAHNMDAMAGRRMNWGGDLSSKYRDKKGRRFAEIINEDWLRAVNKFAGRSVQIEDPLDKYDWLIGYLSQSGGTRSYTGNLVEKWRQEKGLSRTDSVFKKIYDEMRDINTGTQGYMDFLSRHKDIFSDIVMKDKNFEPWYGRYRMSRFRAETMDVLKFSSMMRKEYSPRQRGCLSDMFENFSITNGGSAYPFGLGHGREYASDISNLEGEAFAEFTEMVVVNREALEIAKMYLPNAYEAYMDMIKEAIR